jgi:hypothetical protein
VCGDQALKLPDLLVEHLEQLLRFLDFHCFLFELLLSGLKFLFYLL